MTIYSTKYGPIADRAAISVSILCALHCLATPLALSLYPPLIVIGLRDEIFHLWMLIGVVPLSLFALTLGCDQHKNFRVLGVGSIGIILLCIAALVDHDLVGEWGERFLTLLGALLVAGSHVRNFVMCKQSTECGCE